MPASSATEEKAAAVRRMFGQVAPRYDLLNHLLSLNLDRRWRHRAVERLIDGRPPQGLYLDACAGTFDLALALASQPGFAGRVVASDFAVPMLQRGLPKLGGAPVAPLAADALRLPFRDGTFDGATVGFGIRNLAGLEAGLRELVRVLKPGARLLVLEFTTPTWQPFRALYLSYFLHVLPRVGRVVSRHRTAYEYLPASVLEFPSPPQLAERMRAAGLRDIAWQTHTGGIVATHMGERS